jgi:hydroxymethylglutaryl-CoA synthase
MGLLSTLTHFYDTKKRNCRSYIFFWPTWSQSKGFEGTIQQDWQLALVNTNLFQTLEKSNPIDFITYEKLHKKEQSNS